MGRKCESISVNNNNNSEKVEAIDETEIATRQLI